MEARSYPDPSKCPDDEFNLLSRLERCQHEVSGDEYTLNAKYGAKVPKMASYHRFCGLTNVGTNGEITPVPVFRNEDVPISEFQKSAITTHPIELFISQYAWESACEGARRSATNAFHLSTALIQTFSSIGDSLRGRTRCIRDSWRVEAHLSHSRCLFFEPS